MTGGSDTRIVAIKFSDGSFAYMEAEGNGLPSSPDGRGFASGSDDLSAKFESVAATVGNIALEVKAAIENALPSEATIEFGLDLKVGSAGIGALIVKGDTSASLKVKLKWTRDQTSDKAPVNERVEDSKRQTEKRSNVEVNEEEVPDLGEESEL